MEKGGVFHVCFHSFHTAASMLMASYVRSFVFMAAGGEAGGNAETNWGFGREPAKEHSLLMNQPLSSYTAS